MSGCGGDGKGGFPAGSLKGRDSSESLSGTATRGPGRDAHQVGASLQPKWAKVCSGCALREVASLSALNAHLGDSGTQQLPDLAKPCRPRALAGDSIQQESYYNKIWWCGVPMFRLRGAR
jgi:hypothetical protein